MPRHYNIKDFPQYETSIRGFILIRVPQFRQNIDTIMKEFEKHKFIVPDIQNNIKQWLDYQTLLFLCERFKSNKGLFSGFFYELTENYPFFYEAQKNHFRKHYPEQSFFIEDITMSVLANICTAGGYPNRVLCYFYIRLLKGFTPLKLVHECKNMTLHKMRKVFVDGYTAEVVGDLTRNSMNGIRFFIEFMLIPVTKDLNLKVIDLVEKYGNYNDSFMAIVKDILNIRAGDTAFESYFESGEASKMAHIVAVWVDRMDLRVKDIMISLLKKYENYEFEAV